MYNVLNSNIFKPIWDYFDFSKLINVFSETKEWEQDSEFFLIKHKFTQEQN